MEHDLSVLDFLSDYVCIFYGVPGAYGVVTMPFGVREGVNIFLSGYIPASNIRFRPEALSFKFGETLSEQESETRSRFYYPEMTKTFPNSFKLHVRSGSFYSSEIIVLLGENGTGKTTMIRLLAGQLQPDDANVKMPELSISYKPQRISPKFKGTVKELLLHKIKDAFLHPQFQSDVVK